jgi:Domain of unknown function (DUF4136)
MDKTKEQIMDRVVRVGALAIAILLTAIMAGCGTTGGGTTISYSYDPTFGFPPAKSYRWLNARYSYERDVLLEANVRFFADKQLAARGLSATNDGENLLVWMGYESSLDTYGNGYQLRRLTLNIARADNKELVWRGKTIGTIKADAPADELQKAVEGMLANFPPK